MLGLLKEVDINAEAAISIAAGMRKMAMSDDEVHPSEVEMIEQFLNDVKGEVEANGGDVASISSEDVNLDALSTDELKETFLLCLAMVALADGTIRDEEVALLQDYVDQMGFQQSGKQIIDMVGQMMLSHFKGVSLFRSQAEEIGRALGLDEAAIAQALN